MTGLPLAFLNPWLLVALAGLPALYFLLRLIPPRPRLVDFPPLRLLLDVMPKEETPARTPWWLILLRLGLAALVILALAGPIFNPEAAATAGRGPLVLLIDDGWTAAPDWEGRMDTAEGAISSAETAGRPIAVLGLNTAAQDLTLGGAGSARERLEALSPEPYVRDPAAHLPALRALAANAAGADFVWLSGGIETGPMRAFAEALVQTGHDSRLTVHLPQRGARGLAGADNAPDALTVRVLRASSGAPESGAMRAFDLRGRPLGQAQYRFGPGEAETPARLELPIELRNEVARLELADGRSAAGVQLLDERWQRKSVGLVSGTGFETAQPLLSPTFYLTRALEPFADVRQASSASPSEAVLRFIADGVPVIVLADVGTLSEEARDALRDWMNKGGVLIRFAGSRLAAAEDDDLVPVRLRRGGRVLGGSLAWSTPQNLGAFPEDSPFAGLPVTDEIVVNRQVLAEPEPDLAHYSWAVLTDGTPLVTARRDEAGLLVLFHVTADTVWSNLPISGVFVDMLRRTIALAGEPAPAATGEADPAAGHTVDATMLSPTRTLDGFGAFRSPPPTARPVPATGIAAGTPDHPPGIYGPADGFIAVNTLSPDASLAPLDLSGLPVTIRGLISAEPVPLAPWLLVAAFAAFLLDTLIMLFVGRAGSLRRRTVPAAAIAVLAILAAPHADAQGETESDLKTMQAALETRLAYVITGDAQIDDVSMAGLRGLGLQLTARTAFEPGEPVGIDPETDEMAPYPLIYWPVSETAEPPSADALARIDAYMKRGGTILFDTRDALYSASAASPGGTQGLRRILAGLDIPLLEQVPADHVLTKSFYLLADFPGRFRGSPLWVEALPTQAEAESGTVVRSGDGVSPILITANDFAGAWAIDGSGRTLLPTVPNDLRQRELAYRAGINIVMYALTGNYKADQVHIPALLERLGQ